MVSLSPVPRSELFLPTRSSASEAVMLESDLLGTFAAIVLTIGTDGSM